MIFKNGDIFVFAGDSVTDMGSTLPTGEDNLGNSYVRVFADLVRATCPDVDVRIVNAGVGGDTSRTLLARYDRDVVSYEPQYVSICIGINDVWRQYDHPSNPEQAVFPEEYEKNMRTMIEKSKPTAKRIFLLTPYFLEPNKNDPMRVRMDEYNTILRRLANEYGCTYVDLQAAFDRYMRFRHSYTLSGDRVHPNMMASVLMAREVLDECEFDLSRRP